MSQRDRGTLRAPVSTTVRGVAEAWLDGAKRGEIRQSRSGQRFKPSTLRGYEQALERVLPMIGAWKLSAVTTSDLQALVDRWQGEGLPPATIRNLIKPVQSIYRRAKSRGGVAENPTRDLELPSSPAREVAIVTPGQATALLDVLPRGDRPLWATALFAGLRYGELRALRWKDVDLAKGVISVRRSWDPKAGPIEPKSRKSRRTVPIPAALSDEFRDLRIREREFDPEGLVFGRTRSEPFHAATIYRRADEAWKSFALPAGSLRLHQARHTYASFMIAAGVNAKALSTYMGHSSIKVTFDVYGHLMPGSEGVAADLLDAFLTSSRARPS